MRPKFTLIFILFLLGCSFVKAQNCDPNSPPDEAAAGCACAYPDCDVGLNGFVGLLSDPNGNVTPIPECTDGNGGSFHNDDWIAFIAGTSSISITITPTNCNTVGGLTGVQAGFYSGCDDSGIQEGVPNGGLLVQCACSDAPLTLDYDDFVCGQTYYIFLDGCGGSVCDYSITVNSGSTTMTPPDPLGAISGPTDVCPGQTVTYSINEVDCVPDYVWDVTGGGVIISSDGPTATIQWNSPGTVSVTGENACFGTNTSGPLNVNVTPLDDVNHVGEYCQGDPQGYFWPVTNLTYFAGQYEVDLTINDGGPNDGCLQTNSLIVTENPAYDITVNRTICFGDEVIYGGIPWDQQGSYDIPLTTQNTGCDSIIHLNLTVLDPLSFVNLQPPFDVLTCSQTSIIVDGSQSFPAQDIEFYNWSSPNGGDICGGQGTPVITVCSPGTYCLEVGYSAVDGESGIPVTCTNESCIDVTQDIESPMLSIDFTNPACGGDSTGTATVLINGGAQPFLIAWTDENNTTTETVTDLPAGSYTVSVFSLGNGCTASETVTIQEPDPILLDMSSTSTICSGEPSGSATVVASGGAGGFMYQWDDPGNQTGTMATGLGTGSYTVVVTDANGCTMENTILVEDAAPMSVSIDGVDILCNGDNTGSATATGSGGTGVYTYEWDDANNQVTQTAVDLPAGDYNVIITDENDCTATSSVSLVESDVLELTTNSTEASCGGNADGSATVSPTGGTAPYTYQWNDPDLQETATASDIPAGTYMVVVTDVNGCTAEASVDVDQPSGVTVTTDFVDTQCNGSLDGEASVDAMGGTPPITYQWDDPNNQTDATATGLGAGTYTVIITDANDCSITEMITVGEPPAIELTEGGVNALCEGSTDGEVSVSATGGTPPYGYAWDDPNVQNTATATDLGAGTYTVIVTDANDCTETVSVTITEPTALELTESGVDALCNGSLDGEVSVSATGGTAPYGYSWDDPNNQTDATAIDLGAGTYTVVVTDANGCSETVSMTILEPTELEISLNGTDPDCFNSGDGSASVSATGGTAPYSYSWDDPNGQNTATATGLDAGSFTVIVTDANGCSMTESIDLTAPPAINLDTDQVDILCTTETTGEATVIATGGTPPLSYEWDDNASQNTATATDLGAGTYNVIVTDNNGCSETISVTLTEPAEVLSASGTSTDALCGQNDGTIDVTVTGGTAPYSYNWNGSAPDVQDPTNLGPGSYSVVITDANGCTTTTTVTVESPDSPSASALITDVNCNGEANGAMDITVSGGIAPYTYVWDIPNNGDQDLIDVVAGSYSVTVTDQAGCTTVANGVIPEPDLMEATATPSPADCGIDNGSISVVVSGGVGMYDFDWPGTGQDGTQSPTGLAPGSYEVTITDENGCTVTAAADVIVPNGPSTSLVSTDAGCNGDSTGTVSLTITGGTGPYDIDWGDPNLNGNENLNSLPAGTYDVIVTDANNCTSTGTIDVLEPELLEATVVTTPLTCNGSDDGTSTVTPTGGTAPYTYTWCDGQNTQTAINCPAGDCIVVVTDANGCTTSLTATVDEPAALVADATPVDADCNAAATGSIDVTVSGGTAPYNYTWTGGIPDMQDPVDVGADSYDVVITDANGCTIEITAILVNEPDAIAISSITTDATCNESNGTIDLTVTGGTAPYTYAWTGGLPSDEDPQGAATGSYDVVVTDANGCTAMHTTIVNTPAALGISATPVSALCNGSSTGIIDVTVTGGTPPFTYQWDDPASQTTEDAVDLPAGDYILIVTDDNGCTITVSALVDEPTAIQLSSVSIQTLCDGDNTGGVDLTVIGGTAPYTYQWDDVNGQINEDAIDLTAGTYTVIVTDANGCTEELTEIVDSPMALSTSTTPTDADCFDSNTGAIDLTVMGGTAPYTYQWNDVNAQITEDAIDLLSGTYDVIVTDANGCTITTSAQIDQPEELIVNGTTSQATCSEANGSIDLTVTGGTVPYSYAWTGGLPGDEDPQDVFSGNYDVVVTDANGCTAILSVEVTEPSALGTSIQGSDALCNAEASGSIDLTVTGGSAPYTYQWDDTNAQTTEDATNLLAGTYNVVVTDDNGCTIAASLQIGEPTAIQSSNTTIDALCGEMNGAIDLTVTGGTAPYTYLWSNGSMDEDPMGLLAGSYNVTITDDNGCELEETVMVNTPNQLAATAETFDALCFGSSTGSIDLTITGGNGPYDVVWGGLGAGEDQTDVPFGDYVGIVTDADGCQVVVAASVDQPEELILNGTSEQATCNQANGTIDLTVTGGTVPYSYAWSNGDMIEDPQGVAAGSYDVVVTDANGCSATYTQDVSTPSALGTSTQSEDALCNGSEDGEVDLTVTGGTTPYTYAWSNTATTEDLMGVGAGTYIVTVTDGDGCTITASATIDHPDVLVAVNNAPSDVSCNGGNDGSATIVVNGGTPGYSFDWSDDTYDGQDAPNNLVAGSYTVTVTDANGCTTTELIDISEPDLIVLDASSIAAFCNGASDGSIDLTVAGGTSPFTYDWNNGTYQDQDPQGVTAGNYTVIVTDANGCTETTNVFVDQPAAILVNIGNVSNYGGVNVSCANSLDGSAEASANGGTAPYTFEWSTGVTTSMIDNVGPGAYQVTVTDVNGCTSESQVSLSSPPALDLTADITDPTCFEENDGVILVEGVGGTAPYLYSLDGETFSGLNIFGGLTAGAYTITIQDVNGCEELIDAAITDPQELLVDLGDDIEIQMGDSIQLDPIANIPQFALDTFTWRRTEITDYNPWVGPLQTQTYYITVVNESGCVAEDEIVVRVRKDRLIYIPNAFTPNDDGFNDLFMIHGGQGVKEVKTFRIFNRWGEILFEGLNFQPNDPDFGWNGKFKEERLNPAVFVYLAEVEFIDGRIEIYKGDVTLMR